MSNSSTNRYDKYKDMSIEQLAESIVSGIGNGSEFELKKIIYEQKTIERQFEYNKKQIEFQHELNMKLTEKQLRWIKYAAIMNVVAIISGALLGWFLDTKTEKLQKVQQQRVLKQFLLSNTNS